MLKFLFTFAFLVFILLALLGFSVFRSFKSIFGGNNRRQRNRQSSASSSRTAADNSRRTSASSHSSSRKKVFADDEGEYVDYEEVK